MYWLSKPASSCGTRRSCHAARMACSAHMLCLAPVGRSSSTHSVVKRTNSASFSPGISGLRAHSPCFRAFMEAMDLPEGVFGPVDFCALRRLAATLRSDVIGILLLFEMNREDLLSSSNLSLAYGVKGNGWIGGLSN